MSSFLYQNSNPFTTHQPAKILEMVEWRTHDEHETAATPPPSHPRYQLCAGWQVLTDPGKLGSVDVPTPTHTWRLLTWGGEYDTHVWGGCRWCCRLTVFFFLSFCLSYTFFLSSRGHITHGYWYDEKSTTVVVFLWYNRYDLWGLGIWILKRFLIERKSDALNNFLT